MSNRIHLTLTPVMRSIVDRVRAAEGLTENNEGTTIAICILIARGFFGGAWATEHRIENTDAESALVDEWNELPEPKRDFPDWFAHTSAPKHGGDRKSVLK